MKKFMATLALCALSIVASAASTARDPAQMRDAVLRKTGGFIVAPARGRGIKVVDAKSGVPGEVLEKFQKSVSTGPRFAIVLSEGEPGARYMPDDKCGAVIVVTDDPYSPLTVTVAPEQGWASVNVHTLKADAPNDELFRKRTMKELWRALVYMMGGGNNQMPACVMKPCVGVKDIDNLKMDQACPEPFREMSESAKKLGIAQAKLTSYRRACVEGWAPAPETDAQRAIWEEVHRIPDKPITIEYDPKTDK